jgi:hypothetical protein
MEATGKNPFDDMADDDLGPVPSHFKTGTRFEKRTPTDRAETLYTEPCGQCKGRGNFVSWAGRVVGVCFKCGGTGTLTFKTPKATRDAAKTANAERKETKLKSNLAAYEAQYPQLKAWWTGNDFKFAVDMRDAVSRFGSLTEKQLEASLRCAEKLAAAREQKVVAVANAPTVDVAGITEAFNQAFKKGIKRPKMRVLAGEHRLVLSRAPDNGKNAGAVYVTDRDSDAYLGKVLNNRFIKSRDCDEATEAQVVERVRAHP